MSILSSGLYIGSTGCSGMTGGIILQAARASAFLPFEPPHYQVDSYTHQVAEQEWLISAHYHKGGAALPAVHACGARAGAQDHQV